MTTMGGQGTRPYVDMKQLRLHHCARGEQNDFNPAIHSSASGSVLRGDRFGVCHANCLNSPGINPLGISGILPLNWRVTVRGPSCFYDFRVAPACHQHVQPPQFWHPMP